MTTPLRLKALDLWEKWINQNLWVYPLHWDTTQKLIYTRLTTKAEIAKFFFFETLLVLVGVCSSGFLLIKQIVKPSPEVSILNILIFGISVAGASFAGAGAIVTYTQRRYIVLILKEIRAMEIYFKNHQKSKRIIQTECYDVVGLMMICFVLFGLFLPLIMPFIVYFGIDPLYFIFKMTLNKQIKNTSATVLLLTRIYIETYLLFGAVRVICGTILHGVICIKIILSCWGQVKQNGNLAKCLMNMKGRVFHQNVGDYRRFSIINEILNNELANLALLASCSIAFVIAICTLFMVIRMPVIFKVVPVVYIGMLGLAIAIIILNHIELPEVSELHQLTRDTIRLWKLHSGCLPQRRRLVEKMLSSLKPCSFYAGFGKDKVFAFKRSTPMTYYSVMISYVVTALIADVEVKY